MKLSNPDSRIDAVVREHVATDPKRIVAARRYLLVLAGLFALVAIVSAAGQDWVFAFTYAVLATWTAASMRRFLHG